MKPKHIHHICLEVPGSKPMQAEPKGRHSWRKLPTFVLTSPRALQTPASEKYIPSRKQPSHLVETKGGVWSAKVARTWGAKSQREENLREVSLKCCRTTFLKCLPFLNHVHKVRLPETQQRAAAGRLRNRAEILVALGAEEMEVGGQGHEGEVTLINTLDFQWELREVMCQE